MLVLSLRGKSVTLDGRIRLAEHKARGLPYAPPELVTYSHLEAVKCLVLAGHPERAAAHCVTYAPHLRDQTSAGLALAMDISRQRLIPFREAVRKIGNPSERHKAPRRTLGVLRRVEKLRQMAREGARLTLADLDWVIGGVDD